MLRVCNASGKELAAIPVAELTDVRNLKRHLQGVCGVTRFRQRLLDGQQNLEDELELESPADLQLVLLPFCNVSEDETRMLADAARSGDAQQVEEFLQKPLHPDGVWHGLRRSMKRRRILQARARESEPPIYWACKNRNIEVVRLLLEAGAATDIAIADFEDSPLLATALRDGDLDFAGLLVQAGANVNKAIHVETAGESTPLELSAANGNIELMRMLLRHGADAAHDHGALTRASDGGHVDAVRLLVRAGASINRALELSSANGHVELVRLFLDEGADPANSQALMEASGNGHVVIVERLLTARANMGGALAAASGNGHLQIVQLLLKAGADSNQAQRFDTPLGMASGAGHMEIAQLLLQAGADIDQVEAEGITAVAHAARGGFVEIVRMLLKAGADKDKVDGQEGFTPIWLACREGHLDSVSLLLSTGADKEKVCGPLCATPLWVACRQGHKAIAKLLLAAGADKGKAARDGTRPVDKAAWIAAM